MVKKLLPMIGALMAIAATAGAAEERALWISIGDGPTNLSGLTTRINNAHSAGFNSVVFLSRYRANAYYVPNRTDNTWSNPDPMAANVTVNNDPTQHVIDVAKGLGMRVYAAWPSLIVTDGSAAALPGHINTDWLQWWYSSPSAQSTFAPSSGFPKIMDPTEVPTNNEGHDGYWLDPGVPGAREYVINVLRDFVTNYDIDGVILDRIRFPGDSSPRNTVAWGYNPLALAAYGLTDPPPSDEDFITARRNAVSTFIDEAYAAVHEIKPWVIVGAAPVVYLSTLNSTYNFVYQHFPTWNTAANPAKVSGLGNLDLIMPQLYRSSATTNADLMDLVRPDVTNMAHIPLLRSFTVTGDTDFTVIGERAAINVCDTRTPALGTVGSSFFAASGFFNNDFLTAFQAESTSCGTNVYASPAPLLNFPDKLGWDTTPPGTIGDLVATLDGLSVDLTWSAAADAVGYLVYRSTDPSVPVVYANLRTKSAPVTGTVYSDNGPFEPGNNTYYYKLVAVDNFNNKAASNVTTGVAIDVPVVIIETRDSAGAQIGAPTVTRNGTFSLTGVKSSAPGLTGQDSDFTTTVGRSVTFSPGISVAGLYDIYTTLRGTGNTNAFAEVAWSVSTTEGGTGGGAINLAFNNPTFADTWGLVASGVPFAAGAAGTVGSFTMENVDGDGAGPLPGNRFNADAVRFVWASALPDTVAPISSAGSAIAFANSTNLEITFTASDDQSDVSQVELFVQTPAGGGFATTGLTSSGTSGSFNYTAAAGDGVYAFYTIATDSANNVEAAPGTPDVSVTVDTAAPTATASAPAVKVTGNIAVTANLDGTGTDVTAAILHVRKDGGAWSSAGSILSGSLNYTPTEGSGVYDFYVSATDQAGNERPAPTGATAPDATTLFAATANSITRAGQDGATMLFPMTDDLAISIDFTNATAVGNVTVTRTVGSPNPTGLNGDNLINESITITGSFAGTVNITWNYDPASADGLGLNLTTVYQVNGSTITVHPNTGIGTTVAFGTNTVTINGVTGFSEWYIGDANATATDWRLLND